MISVLRFLQFIHRHTLVPIFGPTCRFHPSCSEYAILAVEKYGVFYGAILAIGRLMRCNPFFCGGDDPLP